MTLILVIAVLALLLFTVGNLSAQPNAPSEYIVVQHERPQQGCAGGVLMFIFGIITTLVILSVLLTG